MNQAEAAIKCSLRSTFNLPYDDQRAIYMEQSRIRTIFFLIPVYILNILHFFVIFTY